jgi:hypothetical protein
MSALRNGPVTMTKLRINVGMNSRMENCRRFILCLDEMHAEGLLACERVESSGGRPPLMVSLTPAGQALASSPPTSENDA